jgi:hypothetical protein
MDSEFDAKLTKGHRLYRLILAERSNRDLDGRGKARQMQFVTCLGPTHRRIPKLCQTSSGIVPRMRLPRTRFCRVPSLITICEAIPPPGISKVAQNPPNPDRLS